MLIKATMHSEIDIDPSETLHKSQVYTWLVGYLNWCEVIISDCSIVLFWVACATATQSQSWLCLVCRSPQRLLMTALLLSHVASPRFSSFSLVLEPPHSASSSSSTCTLRTWDFSRKKGVSLGLQAHLPPVLKFLSFILILTLDFNYCEQGQKANN